MSASGVFSPTWSCASSNAPSSACSSTKLIGLIPRIIPSFLNTSRRLSPMPLIPSPLSPASAHSPPTCSFQIQCTCVPPAQHGQIFCALLMTSSLPPQPTPYSHPTQSLQEDNAGTSARTQLISCKRTNARASEKNSTHWLQQQHPAQNEQRNSND
jgi:hypothetical protein